MRQHRSLSLSLVSSTCTTVGMFSARRIDVRMLSPAFNNDPDWMHLVPEVQHSKINKSSTIYTIESIDYSFTASNWFPTRHQDSTRKTKQCLPNAQSASPAAQAQ